MLQVHGEAGPDPLHPLRWVALRPMLCPARVPTEGSAVWWTPGLASPLQPQGPAPTVRPLAQGLWLGPRCQCSWAIAEGKGGRRRGQQLRMGDVWCQGKRVSPRAPLLQWQSPLSEKLPVPSLKMSTPHYL